MVAADAVVGGRDARRPAELAAGDDQRALIEPAIVHVLNERRERLIHIRRAPIHPLRHVPAVLSVGVIVPAEVELLPRLRRERIDDDDARPGLGEPPREQATLPPQVPAVAVAELGVFLLEVEGARDSRVGEHSQRRDAQLVGPFERAVSIDVAAQPVEVGEQPAALAELIALHAAREVEARRRVAGRVRIAGRESLMAQAEVSRPRHERRARNADVLRQSIGTQAATPAGDHAEVGMLGLRGRGRIGNRRRLAGQHFDRAVVVRRHRVVQRPHDREALREPGLEREDFAEVHAGNGGADRSKRPANLGRRVGLRVPRLELARPAPHPEQDHGRVRARRFRRAQSLGERQRCQRGRRSDTEERPSRNRPGAG